MWGRRSRAEREMADEIAGHIERRSDDLITRGLSRDESLRQARIEFDGIENYREQCREALGFSPWDEVSRNVRFAFRMMRRDPVVTCVIVLSLAIGIGANTAVYSVMNALLLRSLPVAHPEQLCLLNEYSPRGKGSSSYPL